MFELILGAHIVLAIVIITLVLLQHGKGADAGAAFGSGSSQSLFGSQGGTTFMSRVTAIAITLFFITSLSLAFVSTRSLHSVVNTPAQASQPDVDPDVPSLPTN